MGRQALRFVWLRRYESLGGRHAAWACQQRLLRHVSRSAGWQPLETLDTSESTHG